MKLVKLTVVLRVPDDTSAEVAREEAEEALIEYADVEVFGFEGTVESVTLGSGEGDERARTVAFLRTEFKTPYETPDLVLNAAATAIERGEHLPAKERDDG